MADPKQALDSKRKIPCHHRHHVTPARARVHTLARIPALTTEHEVRLTGLPPDNRRYYSVGSSRYALSGDDAGHLFATAPGPGVATFKRNHTPN